MLLHLTNEVDALDSLSYIYHALLCVNVIPGQCTHLTDTKSRTQTNVDSQILECKIALYKLHNFALVCLAQHLYLLPRAFRWKTDVYLTMCNQIVLNAKSQYHLQHNQNILDGLLAQPLIKFRKHKLLNSLLTDVCIVRKCREEVVGNQ